MSRAITMAAVLIGVGCAVITARGDGRPTELPTLQIDVSGASRVVLQDAAGRRSGDVDSTAKQIPHCEYWSAPPGGSAIGEGQVQHLFLKEAQSGRYILVCDAIRQYVIFECVGTDPGGSARVSRTCQARTNKSCRWRITWNTGNAKREPSIVVKPLKQ
jgi:hypothetical protein